MIIYGVALLAFCFLTGNYIGDILGALLGVKANVGGVGFAMLLLIILTNKGIDAGWLDKAGRYCFLERHVYSHRCGYEFHSGRCRRFIRRNDRCIGRSTGRSPRLCLYSYFKKIWCIVIKRMGGVLYGFRSNVH